MSVLTQTQLKALFEGGDTPSEQDFIDLIDTLESNSAVSSTTVAGTNDVWTDVNSTTTIVQTSKQINVISHNGTYYLFNGGIGTYGLTGIATTSANFKQISAQVTSSTVGVQVVNVYNSDANSDMTVTNLANQINSSENLTHAVSQTTIVKYSHITSVRDTYYYLFDGAAGTYGVGQTAVSTANFKPVSVTDAPDIINTILYNVTGTGNVWDDLNSTSQIVVNHNMIAIVKHNGSVYLFNPALDANGNLQIYGASATPATSTNFKLVMGPLTVGNLETRSINSTDYINSVAQDFDFSLYDNFYLTINDTAGQPAGQTNMTASNLVDGKKGYIRIEREESNPIGDQWSWTAPFLVTDLTWDWTANTDSVQYFQYEIIGDRVVIYKIATWDRPFP